MAAPEPDADSFGETSDPAELAQVIQRAEKLLSGQKLYFTTEVDLMEDFLDQVRRVVESLPANEIKMEDYELILK